MSDAGNSGCNTNYDAVTATTVVAVGRRDAIHAMIRVAKSLKNSTEKESYLIKIRTKSVGKKAQKR